MLIRTLALRHRQTPMITRAYRTTLYASYQASLVAGITLLPVAIFARQAGIPLPVHRVIQRLRNAYDATLEDGEKP